MNRQRLRGQRGVHVGVAVTIPTSPRPEPQKHRIEPSFDRPRGLAQLAKQRGDLSYTLSSR